MKTKIKTKTAAIYDRWLSTLGGGEQVVFAYAQTLLDLGYQVTLITHKSIDPHLVKKKMGINLNEISIEYIPEQSSSELSFYSEKFDLFINSSYLDYFPNRSHKGILSVFFPSQIFISPIEYLKRALVVPSLKSFFIYPLRYENFIYDDYKHKQIRKWLSQKSRIIFKNNVQRVKITLYFETVAFSVLETIVYKINNRPITPADKFLNHNQNLLTLTFDLPPRSENSLEIELPDHAYAKKVALIRLTIPNIRYSLYNLFKRFFPVWEMRLHGGPGITKRADLESYHQIVTISEFCQKWIKKYWKLDSIVLYPPVNTRLFKSAAKKKNSIMHVGRFFVTGHNKKQLDMIKIFKRLVDNHQVKGWELNLVGSVHDGSKHQEYFEKCQEEAAGYNIKFHTNTPFAHLKKLLSQSKIYWHATGLDEDESKNPIVFEHFGITTVEAMASGCVPVVIDAAGQSEIVTSESGFKWKNRNEWMKQTLKLINNPKLLNKIKANAIKRSHFFSREEFKKRFSTILKKL